MIKNKMIPRVLIVDVSDNFGGANARVLALMKMFPKDQIGLATLTGSKIALELEELGYKVHRLARSKFDPCIVFSMIRVIREFGYQIVDTQNPNSKLWGSFSAFIARVPLISTLNSWYMNEHPRFSKRWFLYTALELLTNFSLSRYIVVSRQIQSDMINIGVSPEKIDLIQNAVNLDNNTIYGEKKVLLTKFGWQPDSIVCLAAGRLVWAKAHDDLLEALALARESNPAICCIIAGEGTLYKTLEQKIKALNLQNYVVLPGHYSHTELLSVMKACDIYVMPSRTEGTPVALLEAAALGKPIVASRVGGIPQMVKDGEQALLFEKGNVIGLSENILHFARDLSKAQEFGKKAQMRVEAEFSLEVQASLTTDAYSRAVYPKRTLKT
ncbi:MAG: glycosyltransferase family 4 protein [Anaerolineales bacterium]|nr:glycosyltransferase family 4 protein [Anaerolineales bacterium]